MEKKRRVQNQNNAGKAVQNSSGFWFLELLKIVLTAVIIAVVVKSFLVDSRVIPSTSMVPTISVGDRVIVSKLSYLGNKEPQRGDIIVFKAPAELQENDDLIKRVIGLPGETVEIYGGQVYIDGTPLDEPYLAEAPAYNFGPVTVPANCYLVLGDNRNVSIDSHFWVNPFLDGRSIKGKAVACYWPISHIGDLYE